MYTYIYIYIYIYIYMYTVYIHIFIHIYIYIHMGNIQWLNTDISNQYSERHYSKPVPYCWWMALPPSFGWSPGSPWASWLSCARNASTKRWRSNSSVSILCTRQARLPGPGLKCWLRKTEVCQMKNWEDQEASTENVCIDDNSRVVHDYIIVSLGKYLCILLEVSM